MPIFRRFVTVSPLRLLLLSHHLRHVHLTRHLFVDLLLKELDLLECSLSGGAFGDAVVPADAAERALAHHSHRHADLAVHRALGTSVRERQHNNVKYKVRSGRLLERGSTTTSHTSHTRILDPLTQTWLFPAPSPAAHEPAIWEFCR